MFERMMQTMMNKNSYSQMLAKRVRIAVFPLFALWTLSPVFGQTPVADSPMSRMRPIGTYGSKASQAQQGRVQQGQLQQIASRRSALSTPTNSIRETGYQAPAGGVQLARPADRQLSDSRQRTVSQQTVQLQQFESPLPGALPLPDTVPANPSAGAATPNPGLPPGPIALPGGAAGGIAGQVGGPNIVSPSDQTPIPTPQLNNGFATISNCNLVSGPSSYSAASFGGCAPASYQAPVFQQNQSVPGQGGFVAPAVLPNGLAPQSPFSGAGVPGGALISFGQQANSVVVGQGLFGQPVAYVPGQTFRNWVRYVFP